MRANGSAPWLHCEPSFHLELALHASPSSQLALMSGNPESSRSSLARQSYLPAPVPLWRCFSPGCEQPFLWRSPYSRACSGLLLSWCSRATDGGPTAIAIGYTVTLGVIAAVQIYAARRVAVTSWRRVRDRWSSLLSLAVPDRTGLGIHHDLFQPRRGPASQPGAAPRRRVSLVRPIEL